MGTQYRSGIYTTSEAQHEAALASRGRYPERAGRGLRRDHDRDRGRARFFYAEDYHQQYLAKNPDGYCGLGGTGVSCPVGVAGA